MAAARNESLRHATGDWIFWMVNNSILTVMDLLLDTNQQAVNGVLYNGDSTKKNDANSVYSALNKAGGIN